jgi:cytochrome c-type biogenesis protein CcmH
MKKLNSLPTWILMLLLTVSLLAFGTLRDRGPLTQQGRIDAISQQLACPTCNGESIYVSRAPAAEAIRNEIAREVAAGQSSDDQIVAVIEQSFPGSVLLPRTDGVESLIWILPVVALVGGLCVLALVFRRWKNAAILNASDEDFAIVDAALLHKNDVTDNENI